MSRHAIVVGGGIAGLLSARILAHHFGRVTLLERDRYPEEPVFRSGVPQGRQVHTMLLRGQQIVEQLFPGITTRLYAHGAVEQFYGHKSFYSYKGQRAVQIPPVLQGWNCSRMLLEHQIHEAVRALPQVHIIEGADVIRLLSTPQSERIRGVQFRKKEAGKVDINCQDLEADMVVDASGALSHAPQWLKSLGYASPHETIVNAHIHYATQTYEQPKDWSAEWTGIAIQARDQARRGAVLMRVEQQRWMVAFSKVGDEGPAFKGEEYVTFARQLPDPSIYEAIKDAKPITPIYSYKRTENRLRHFERIQLPENFVLVGDAVCNLNPVYGQGMTVAALQALALDDCLKRHQQNLSGFADVFQRRVAHIIRGPWLLAASADTPQNTKPSLASRYMDGIFDVLASDQKTLLTFLEVLHMLRPPTALFHPDIVIKVMTRKRR